MLKEVDDPELKVLASKLPSTILHSSHQPSCTAALTAPHRAGVWAIAHKLNPVPAKPHEFVLYLQHIGEMTSSKSAVEEACNAVAWIHTTAGLTPIIAHPFVMATLED